MAEALSMPDPDHPSRSPEALDQRVREARARAGLSGTQAPDKPVGNPLGTGLSAAWRIGVEMVAALIVGVGIGLLLDGWLGTAPWGLVVFLLLGTAAGVLNVYRAALGMSDAVGWQRRDGSRGRDGRRD